MKAFLLFINLVSFVIYATSFTAALANGLLLATTISFVCVVVITLCLLASGKDAAFSPLLVLLLINMYSNVARLNLIASDPRLMKIKYYLSFLPTNMLNDAAILVGLGTIAICAGYMISITQPAKIPRTRRPVVFSRTRSYLFYGSFLVLLFFFVLQSDNSQILSAKRYTLAEDGTRYTYGPLRFALQIMLASLQIMFVFMLTEARKRKLELFIIMFLMALTAVLISKRSIIFFGLIPVIMISLHKVNIRKIFGLSLLASLIIIIVFQITELRSEIALSNSFLITNSYENIVSLFVFTVVSANFGGVVPTAISTFLIEDNIGWLIGRTWVMDPVAQFVPRNFWPGKPEELGGQIRLIHQDMGLVSRYIYGGVPPGVFAEAWLNFRVFGVIAFSFLYGLWFGLLFKLATQAYRSDRFFFSLIVFLGINTTFFLYGGHVARAVNFSVQLVIGFAILRAIGVFRYKRI